MGLRDIIRRRRADTEPQGDDFIEDDFIVPAGKLQANCQQVKEEDGENATDNSAQ